MKKTALLFFASLTLFTTGCGLQDYAYLAPATANTQTSNYAVTFWLPETNYKVDITFQQRANTPPSISSTGGLGGFFDEYYIFYRIYLSTSNNSGPSDSNYATINSKWNDDYNFFKPYTITTNNMASSVKPAFFKNYGFYRIHPDSEDGTLRRSSELIEPYPLGDRDFYTSSDLINPALANINNNADVFKGTGTETFAWAAMYVVRKGYNQQTVEEYYSTPTFLGFFLLPPKS